MLLQFGALGVTMSWEEAHPGARASRPHKSSRSFGHLLHRNQPAAAPCLCFGRAHAVPAGRAVGCNIAGKLSGNRRDSMRAGRPRSRVGRPDGEVAGKNSRSGGRLLRKPTCTLWETPVCPRAVRTMMAPPCPVRIKGETTGPYAYQEQGPSPLHRMPCTV